MTAIPHIPGAACAPRTVSEANRRAEGEAILRRIKAAKCPPLHTVPAPSLRPMIWAVGLFIIVVLIFVAEALWGWQKVAGAVGVTVFATGLIIWSAGTSVSVQSGPESVSEERPFVERGDSI
jgi:hypothetical protein